MNRTYIWLLILVVLQSCKSTNEQNGVILSEFCTDLISLYCRDLGVSAASEPSKQIIMISSSDSSYYYLSIFANTPTEYEYCRNDIVGATESNGILTRVFGEQNPMFFTGMDENSAASPCNPNHIEYDPDVWVICFYKDGSFCKMKTRKATVYEDISDLIELAGKYFEVSSAIPMDAYGVCEVEEEPKFAMGEESLQSIIDKNFSKKYINTLTEETTIVHIIVDENGVGTVQYVALSSGNRDVDNEAIRVAHIICKSKFIPASHRGQKVKAVYPISFKKKQHIKL